jgi:DHA2 family multidrug resistance protein
MVGPILGPTLGGYLSEFYHWRWVFYINLPVGILTFLGLSTFLAETKGERPLGFDWFGFMTLSLAIGAFQMMLDRGEQLDWFASPEILAEAAISALALYLFLVHTFTTDRPFIDPRLFRDRNFSTGLVFIFIVGVILLATLALITPFLQGLLGYPVLTAGLVMAPRGMGTMAGMLLVGRLINRIDPRWLIATGFALTAISLWEMTGFNTDVGQAAIIRTGVVQGMGLGFIFVPLSTITFATLEPQLRTAATSLYSLMRNIGSSIGISLVIWLLGRNTQVLHAELGEHVTTFDPFLRHLPAAWDVATTPGRAALDAELTRQALTIAYLNDFKLMMLVALVTLPFVLLLRRPRRLEAASAAALE